MFFQLPLIQQKRLYRRCFLINAERERFSHKYGGCGAIYIKYQRCPATAVPFESRFLARAPRRAKGKGVKRSSRRLRSSQSHKKVAASARERARGAKWQRAKRGQSLTVKYQSLKSPKTKKQAPSLTLALYPIQIRLPYTNRRIISSRSPARKSMMGISIIV